jgi:hypothetical protein
MCSAALFLNVLFNNHNDFANLKVGVTIVGISLFFIMIYIFSKWKISEQSFLVKYHLWIISIAVVVFAIVQTFFLIIIQPSPVTDTAHIYNGAVHLITHPQDFGGNFSSTGMGKEQFQQYYSRCPNNIPILLAYYGILKVASFFNVTNYFAVIVGVNVVLVSLSVLFTSLVARQLYGWRSAYFALLCCMFLQVFLVYSILPYTDTYSLLFPILGFYLYLRARDVDTLKAKLVYFSFMGLVVGLGAEIKFTAIIILIAIAADVILRKQTKRYIIPLLSSFVTLFMVMQAFTLIINYSGIFQFKLANANKMTYTHYLVMGIQNNGRYSGAIQAHTLSFSTPEARIKENKRIIKQRLKELGFTGYLKFLYNKMNVTYGDGTFRSPLYVRYVQDPKAPFNPWLYNPDTSTFTSQYFKENGKYFFIQHASQQIVWFTIFLLIIINGISNILTPDPRTIIPLLTIFGISFVLSLWETNSRYLINLLPIFIIAATAGVGSLNRSRGM